MQLRWMLVATATVTATTIAGCPGTGPGAAEPATTPEADGRPDGDADRIPDGADACPSEAEVYNGRDDEDGCPDCAGMMLLVDWVQPAVWFDRGVDALRPDNVQALDAVVEALEANAAIEQVACLGTASLEEPGPERLARNRAQAVLDALVARGVAPERLVTWSEVAPAPTEPGRGGLVHFLLVRANGAAIRRAVDGGWEMADELGPPPDDGFPSCRLGTASWLGCDGVPFHVTLPPEAGCCDEAACRAGCEAGGAVACRALGLLRWQDVLRTDQDEVQQAFRRACELGDEVACGMLPGEPEPPEDEPEQSGAGGVEP